LQEPAESEEEAWPSRRTAAPRSRRRQREEVEAGEEPEEGGQPAAAAAQEGRQRKRQRRAHGGWRELKNYAWLAVAEQTPGVYVPQVRGCLLGSCTDFSC
jgi:hypothetical protein